MQQVTEAAPAAKRKSNAVQAMPTAGAQAQAKIDAAAQALASAEQASREARSEFERNPSTATFTQSEVAKQLALNAAAALDAARAEAQPIFEAERRANQLARIEELTAALRVETIGAVVDAYAAQAEAFRQATREYAVALCTAVHQQRTRAGELAALCRQNGVAVPGGCVAQDLGQVAQAANARFGFEVWPQAEPISVTIQVNK